MEDPLPLLTCPNCKNWLIESAVSNLELLSGSACPYCGCKIKWAPFPVVLLLLGVIGIGTGVLGLINKVSLVFIGTNALPFIFGIGVACFLLGAICSRFNRVRGEVDKVHYAPNQ